MVKFSVYLNRRVFVMGQLKAISVISGGPFEPILILDFVGQRKVTGKIFLDPKHIYFN